MHTGSGGGREIEEGIMKQYYYGHALMSRVTFISTKETVSNNSNGS